MEILLDSDVVLRGEKRHFSLTKWLLDRPDDGFRMAAITVAELWHGVERATGRQRANRERFLQGLISHLPIVPYTEQTARVHA